MKYTQVEQLSEELLGNRCLAQGHPDIWPWRGIKPVTFWSRVENLILPLAFLPTALTTV